MSILYAVATPIGNLEDITLRALKVLNSVDLVLCEDTRVSKKLFAKHGISKPTLSYHAHSKISRSNEIVQMLRDGKNLALISDAGTPGISDPGIELVSNLRRELSAEIADGSIKIESVPGPSALTAALSVAGISAASFTFLGFLPHKKGRETLFNEIAAHERTYVFYESPHRIMKTLESLQNTAPGKIVTVCRELTKIYEEVVSDTPEKVLKFFSDHSEKIRGEFVVIVSKSKTKL